MQARRKRIVKRLTRRARQEDEAEHRDRWQWREQRKADIMRSFERRRIWFVALIVAFVLTSTLLTLAPAQIWQSWIVVLIVVVLVVRVGPLVARYTLWRCPNCNKALPLDTRFGPFERRRENCPHCGVRLE